MVRILHLLGGGILCGAGEYALKLSEGLADHGFAFTLATLKRGPLMNCSLHRGIETILIEKRFPGDVSVVFRLAKAIRRRRFDILHTHTANSHFYGRLGAWISGSCRTVSTEHAFYTKVFRESVFLRMGYWLDLRMARHVDCHIAVSNAMKEKLVQDGLDPDNIKVIPNGVDLEALSFESQGAKEVRKELGFGESDILVGTTGRLTRVKNHELLIRSADRIAETGVSVHFLIAGDGPRLQSLKAYASRTRACDRIHFLGWRTDLPRVISALDIFVSSSFSEVAPFSVLEAMALERPVVATSVGGILEIIENGQTGISVPSDDTDAFVHAILFLVRHPEERVAMGKKGRHRVAQHFSKQRMIEQTARAYRSVLPVGVGPAC